MVKVTCDRCGEEYLRKDREQHEELCPEKMVTCPDCGLSIKRAQMEGHNCVRELVARYDEQSERIKNLEKANKEYEERFINLELKFQNQLH